MARARRSHAGLIVISATYGRRGAAAGRALAVRLGRSAPCPVLVVPATGRREAEAVRASFRRVVCAVDFTNVSLLALEAAAALAPTGGGQMTLVHAVGDITGGTVFSGSEVAQRARYHAQHAAAAARSLLQFVPSEVLNGYRVKPVVGSGPPARRILEVASETKADVVVMGVPRRSRIDEWLGGSISLGVLRRAHAPSSWFPRSGALRRGLRFDRRTPWTWSSPGGHGSRTSPTIRPHGRGPVCFAAARTVLGGIAGQMKPEDLLLADVLDFQPGQGIIRLHEQRVVILSATAMGLLRKELIDTLGIDTARRLLLRFGFADGYHDAVNLRERSAWADPVEGLRAGAALHTLEGIVRATPLRIEYDSPTGRFDADVEWHESYEAEQHVHHYGRSEAPVCWTLVGYASGYASACLGQEVYFSEATCQGQGGDRCSWSGRTQPAGATRSRGSARTSRDRPSARRSSAFATPCTGS